MMISTFKALIPFLTLITACEALSSNAKHVCDELVRGLGPSTVVLPSDPRYANISTENWSQTTWKRPACIAVPSKALQVQQVVKTLVKKNVPFAIRSGGHSPNPLDASIDGTGVLISTGYLNVVTFDPVTKLASLGPGARWKEVYSVLDKHRVTVVGGRVLDVGVGGLLLGGGLSYLTDLYGMACDNIVSYQVVLANGDLVHATERSHRDLFWALKGGANNFGVVTEFKLKTYPIYLVWGSVRVFAATQTQAVLQAVQAYQSQPNKDLYANMVLNVVPTNYTVILTMVYLKPVEKPSAFRFFYHLTPLSEYSSIMPLSTLMSLFPAATLPRWTWWTLSFKPSGTLYTQMSNLLATSPEVKTIQHLTAGTMVGTVQPINQNVALAGRRANSVGGNVLGLEAVNQTWISLNAGWWDQKDDKKVHAAVFVLGRKIQRLVQPWAQIDYIFMNDANADQGVIGSYGRVNVLRLKLVKWAYDPLGAFSRLVKGGQKVPAL
ncbi:bifunctional solanapyrone synthase [Rhypophila decipiens]|uniref:Bifunctional solanapyrone synthase n=1 Tax=Rhypophila decipiens TaxID=261697 RepID=A0AAN6XVB5_9PEZI|nr:bifunctional solanapyrone synthase [Rhypophila decipiens]